MVNLAGGIVCDLLCVMHLPAPGACGTDAAYSRICTNFDTVRLFLTQVLLGIAMLLQAPQGKPVSLAITPDKQLLQQALERAAIAAAATAAAVGGSAVAGAAANAGSSSSNVPLDMWPPAVGGAAGGVASRRVTGTPSEGTRSHRVTGGCESPWCTAPLVPCPSCSTAPVDCSIC
jgi:hypothetical protein